MSLLKPEPDRILKNPHLAAAQKGENKFWSYLGTLALITSAALSATIIVGFSAISLSGVSDPFNLPPISFLIVNMAAFPAAIWGLWIGIHLLHRRSLKSLVTPFGSLSWRNIFAAAGLWFGLGALTDLFLALTVMPENYVWQFDPVSFFPFAAVALLLVPIQTTAEELIFRGYLLQGSGLLTRQPWAAVLLSSLLFASLHLSNPEVSTYGLPIMITYYLCMGIFLCVITLRTKGLEAALGLHAANNLYAILVVTFPGTALPSPAFFRMLEYDSLLGLIAFLVMILLYLILSEKLWNISKNPTENQL